MILTGKTHVYGDDIDTDRIIPGKYTKTLDTSTLANHVLEDLDPEFKHNVQAGDILVAGKNFGCGSSREQAPLALQKAGVSVVIAEYFARIFFRNAINIGLAVLEIPNHTIEKGAKLEVNLSEGIVKDLQKDVVYIAAPLPKVMIDILTAGGLTNYLKQHDTYQV